MLYEVTINMNVGVPLLLTVDADSIDEAEEKAAPRPRYWMVGSVQVCPIQGPKRTTPHISTAMPRKGKRVQLKNQNVPSKWFGDSAVISGRSNDGEDIAGELSLGKPHHRGLKSPPLTNALGFTSPVAKAVKHVYGPRREGKHTLVMSSKGFGPRYQGLDSNGRHVWSAATL